MRSLLIIYSIIGKTKTDESSVTFTAYENIPFGYFWIVLTESFAVKICHATFFCVVSWKWNKIRKNHYLNIANYNCKETAHEKYLYCLKGHI